MVTSCSAHGCRSSARGKDAGVSFHRFPRDPDLRKKWVLATQRKNFDPGAHIRLCSKHFKANDFYPTFASGLRKLRENVVPSLFTGPLHSQDQNKENDKEKDRSTVIEPEKAVTIAPSTQSFHQMGGNVSLPIIISVSFPEKPDLNHKQPDLNPKQPDQNPKQPDQNPKQPDPSREILELSLKLKVTSEKLEIVKKKLKAVRVNNSRLKKKQARVKSLVRELKQKDAIIEEYKDALDSMPDIARQMCGRVRKRGSYSSELKEFAIKLYFFSPKAYRYVRNTSCPTLPHPRTISKWYPTINVDPGVRAETLQPANDDDSACTQYPVLCSLDVNGIELHGIDVNELEVDGLKEDELEVDELEEDELEVNELEVKEIEVNELEVNELEVDGLEANEMEVNEMEVNETEVNETEVNETEVNETEVNETEVNETEVNETEVNEIEVNEIEVSTDECS